MPDDSSKLKYELKKQLKVLREIRGSGTELISLYIAPGAQIADSSNKLKEECGQAANIKSKSTRKNVQWAIEKLLNFLKIYRVPPPRGMAIFCGNVSRDPGRPDIKLYCVEPPEPLKTQFYRCDSTFVLEPLEAMVDVKDTYGLLVMDGREATIATLRGKTTNIIRSLNSTAHSKTRMGGQCIAPDTLVQKADGGLCPVSSLEPGMRLKALNLETREIGDFACSDVFKTTSKRFHRIRTHAPLCEIEATPFHRFLVLCEHGIKEKYAKDLQPGDALLAARRVPHEGQLIPTGFVAETRVHLTSEECARIKKRRIELGLSQPELARRLGLTQTAISMVELGKRTFSKRNTLDLYRLLGVSLDPSFLESDVTLPSTVTPGLAYLLGAICGDGTLDETRIILYEGSEELARSYAARIREVFGRDASVRQVDKTGQRGSFARKPYFEVRLYSTEATNALASAYPELFAESGERGVPQAVQKSGVEVIAQFLHGLYDAEGYVQGKRASIAGRSKRLMREVQALLLRLGIESSLAEKKVRGNPQWSACISDRESLRAFAERIGFTRADKRDAIRRACSLPVKAEPTNQVAIDGREAYRIVKEAGFKTSDFRAASCFFRNKKPLGREAFKRNILDVLERRKGEKSAAKAYAALKTVFDGDVIPARVARNELVEREGEFYDLTIPNAANFVANGLVVHNSARRYERLIEEGIELYYKRIGEALDVAFVGMKDFRGLIVAGPGPAKEDFTKMNPMNYQIKILGVLDTGYTDEAGVMELVGKADSVISEQEAIKEKRFVAEFIKSVVTDGAVAYGEKEVREALESGRVKVLLLSEDLDLKKVQFKCSKCGVESQKISSDADKFPHECGGEMQAQSEEELAGELIKLAEEKNIAIEMISSETTEGAQFLQSFLGVGALLKY